MHFTAKPHTYLPYRLTLFICMLLACLPLVSRADSSLMRYLSVREGFIGESIYRIIKDRQGYLWLATYNGVTRYDGINARAFTNSRMQPSTMVSDVAEAHDGTIYAASHRGLYKVGRDSLERTLPEIDCQVHALATDGKLIYIGSANGLYVYDGQQLDHYPITANQLSGQNFVTDATVDHDHRLWLTTRKELLCFDPTTHRFTHYPVGAKLLPIGELHCLTVIGQYVYLGTDHVGMLRFDKRKKTFNSFFPEVGNVINELSTDGRGHLYVATDGNGLHDISVKDNRIENTYDVKSVPYNLKDNTVYSFMRDEHGVVFFGLYRQGLAYIYYNQPLFSTYKLDTFSTAGINVRSFSINDGHLLLGTRNGFYYVDEHQNLVYYVSPAQLGSSIVTDCTWYEGRYIICTYDGGVKVFDPQTYQLMPFPGNSIINKTNSFTTTIHKGQLWIATAAGLFCFDRNLQLVHEYNNRNSSLPQANISSIAFDAEGNGWIGTSEGVYLYDGVNQIIRTPKFPDGYFNEMPMLYYQRWSNTEMMAYCKEGLWLTHNDMSQWETIDVASKLQSRQFIAAVTDASKQVWVATDKGLFCMDREFDRFIQLGYADNMNATAFSTAAAYVDKEGLLWLGSDNGLLYADTRTIWKRHLQHTFPIIITRILANQTELAPEDVDDANHNHSLAFAWSFGQQTLTLMPAILSYSNPDNSLIEYRLDNGSWHSAQTVKGITLPNPSLGRHTLYLRQPGSEHPTEYRLNIYPSRQVLLLFVILVLGMVLAAVYWLRRQRRARLERAREERERMLLERDKEREQREKEREALLLEAQQRAEQAAQAEAEREAHDNKPKYSKVKQDKGEMAEIARRMEEYIETQRPYLDPSLKLAQVASALGVSSSKLSQVFSLYLNQNYYDYINGYRLQEFKRRIANGDQHRFTLLAISEQCGFKKTSFFATFKKLMNTTPSEYVQQIEESAGGNGAH